MKDPLIGMFRVPCSKNKGAAKPTDLGDRVITVEAIFELTNEGGQELHGMF